MPRRYCAGMDNSTMYSNRPPQTTDSSSEQSTVFHGIVPMSHRRFLYIIYKGFTLSKISVIDRRGSGQTIKKNLVKNLF